ncbi:MAG TPA: multicopper oxidase domain-containing protein [Thermomicrobiales bacterium]|nr:multicopper oxidase domain-containing protein [Thermomicrobiales bacterium]
MSRVIERLNRREMLGGLGALGLTGVGVALAPSTQQNGAVVAADVVSHADHDDMVMTSNLQSETPSSDEMDAMHEAGVKSFPAATKGKGGQPLDYTMDGDVKVFELTCEVVEWEYNVGQTVEAWTYNGVVPGPEIRVTEGDKCRFHVTNKLPQSTAIHWHGLYVPNDQDGVPFMTQPPIKPGETYTYEFTIKDGNAGSHMYHSHSNSAFQVTSGLLGPFIVEPKDPSTRPAFDVEYTMILNDGPIGAYSLNGKTFPATEPIVVEKGQTVLIRYMNEGLMIHPMHLHGMRQQVIAQDGWLLPQPYYCDTLNIAPGQRFEALVEATEPGVWAYHCHILSHAESEHGMFGMVTALIVQDDEATPAS